MPSKFFYLQMENKNDNIFKHININFTKKQYSYISSLSKPNDLDKNRVYYNISTLKISFLKNLSIQISLKGFYSFNSFQNACQENKRYSVLVSYQCLFCSHEDSEMICNLLVVLSSGLQGQIQHTSLLHKRHQARQQRNLVDSHLFC